MMRTHIPTVGIQKFCSHSFDLDLAFFVFLEIKARVALARASLRILKWGVQSMASGSEPEIFLSVPPIRGVQNSTRAINLGVHATA